jgi:hypothetical protein
MIIKHVIRDRIYYKRFADYLCSHGKHFGSNAGPPPIADHTEEEKTKERGRVLMLHGWAANAEMFRNQTKILSRKLNQAGYDCIYLEGPHVLPEKSAFSSDDGRMTIRIQHEAGVNGRAWFLYDKNDPSNATSSKINKPLTFWGLDDSLAIVQEELQRQVEEDTCSSSPMFTALFGFSQAAVLGHIVSLLVQREPQRFGRLCASILVSGLPAQHMPSSTSRYNTGRLLDREQVRLPSLHIFGTNEYVHEQIWRRCVEFTTKNKYLTLLGTLFVDGTKYQYVCSACNFS